MANNVTQLCDDAANRMRGFPSLHGQYTLHDEVHLLRVTELMGRIMPAEVLQKLNPVEIALLILAAHFHDQGMVPERDELAVWRDDTSPNPDFVLFRQNWAIDHPNLELARRQANDPALGEEEKGRARQVEADLLDALLSDYLRETHGQRAAAWLRTYYAQDPRLLVQGAYLTDALARLCLSHVGPVSALTEANGFRVDERIGLYSVNLVYLALVLRLADILDFDRERTPDSLYRTIDFRSPISLTEWGKHRAVTGWQIGPDAVQFTLECEHPEYERAARRFMDYIDEELQNATQRIREFPSRARAYTLDLPVKTDRSRIKPKDNAYIYHDLEFSLSRDEVVKLLMTDKLYGSPALCVRELLQNSLDALRHRTALHKRDGVQWPDGKVEMVHEVDAQGHEVVRCVDNGIGMSRAIVLNFLTKAGRSYYRSPQFEQERIGLRTANVDFDPCAQFGIGFMSVFMLGDHIVIHTRRDNGPTAGHDEPLVVEINGIGGIVVLRPGLPNQPIGTSVTITGRKKPRFLDVWADKVKLVSLLTHYALATEFPIEARCTVPGISKSVSIPSVAAKPKTLMETLGIRLSKTLEVRFETIDARLSGFLRASFLIDQHGGFVLENEEACWHPADPENHEDYPSLWLTNEDKALDKIWYNFNYDGSRSGPVSLDGIFVGGRGGREDIAPRGHRLIEQIHSAESPVVHSNNFVSALDVRGAIKPPLTPARVPARMGNRFSNDGPKWGHIQKAVRQAEGILWEQVAKEMNAVDNPELFWQLGLIYCDSRIRFTYMNAQACWTYLALPVLDETGSPEWVAISCLGKVFPTAIPYPEDEDEREMWRLHTYCFFTGGGKKVATYDGLTQWGPYDINHDADAQPAPGWINHTLTTTVLCLSTLLVEAGKVVLQAQLPNAPNDVSYENILRLAFADQDIAAIYYAGEASIFFCRSCALSHHQSFARTHATCFTGRLQGRANRVGRILHRFSNASE